MFSKLNVPRTEAPAEDPYIEHINVWPGDRVSINTSDRNTNPVFKLVDKELPEDLVEITNKFCAAWAAHLSGDKAEDIEYAIVADFEATKAAIAAKAEPIEELKP